ncbi:MAG TPA: GntR family transcriptional regulator [Candidatus Limnocylindrales bacterium]|nr:GntR family transcriptional regulator [Candidatus Limnocylindrales bacterium]
MTSVAVTYARQPLRADIVRDGLREAIFRGEFPPGSKLPNEERLCARFRVSRTTIREAVRGLVEEGFLVRRQGSGTFVTSRPLLRNSLDINFGYTDLIESMGMRAGQKRLRLDTVRADESVARLLGLEVGDEVVRLDRVRTADGRPVIYSIDYLPRSIVDPDAHRADLEHSVYHLLERLGLPVDHGEATITPVLAEPYLARILQVRVGEPLQHLVQVDFTTDGRPVLLSYEWHVPSVIQFRVYRKGPHQGLSAPRA